jgi:hypothetical protein
MISSIEKSAYTVLGYLNLNISITAQKALIDCGVSNLAQAIEYLRSKGVEIYEKTYQQQPKALKRQILVYSLCDLNNPHGECLDEAAKLECVHEGDCSSAA